MSYPVRKIQKELNRDFKLHKRELKSVNLKHKKKKKNFFALLFLLLFIVSYAYYVCPYNFKVFFRPVFLNRFLNKNIIFNAKNYTFPTLDYIYNSSLLSQNIRVDRIKNNQLKDIKIINEMTQTKDKLLDLAKKYPELTPSVYVWEYSTSSGLEIGSNQLFPSASIIKIPIAFELMRLLDKTSKTPSPISLSERRVFSEFFRTSGSGNLQKTRSNVSYTLDYLANIMISESDNSATNMLLYEIGGMDGFNRSMRNLGFNNTSISNWLPDLDGTNKITAYEISKIIYNIDNPVYINSKFKIRLKEYLGNTKNVHLIKEKLPDDVMILHKTGDIAEMLGDAGIVYANNGKKYIVTILVKRPKNAHSAKILIQDMSKIIFDDIKNLR